MINRFVRAHQKRDLGMEVEDGIQSAEGLVTNMEHLEKSCLDELIHLNRDIFNL